MEEFNQQMELIRKQQQNFDQGWERLRKKQQDSFEQIRKSFSNLAQLILETQGVSNPSLVASQLFDIMPENKQEETTPQVFDEKPEQKLELTDFKLQGKTAEIVEQPSLKKQTTIVDANPGHFEALKLQMEKVNPSITESYSLPCFITHLKSDPHSTVRFYHPNESYAALGQSKLPKISERVDMEELKPKPTFRSPITTSPWTHNTPNNLKPKPTFRSPIATTPLNLLVSASNDTKLYGQNLNNLLEAKSNYPSYASNAISNCSPLDIPHSSGYDLLSASQVSTTNNSVHVDYTESLSRLEHSSHWSGLWKGLTDGQQAQLSQLDGNVYAKGNYFNQGLYESEGMGKFEEAFHSIEAFVMEKEIESGFKGQGDYKSLLGEIPKFVSSNCPNLQSHPISNLSENGAENISWKKTSNNLMREESWSGGSCLAPSLKPPKDYNLLLREGIGVAAKAGTYYTKPICLNGILLDGLIVKHVEKIHPSPPPFSENPAYGVNIILNNNLSDGTNGWVPLGNCSLKVATGSPLILPLMAKDFPGPHEPLSGHDIMVTKCTQTWMGPAQMITDRVKLFSTYQFPAWIMIGSGVPNVNVALGVDNQRVNGGQVEIDNNRGHEIGSIRIEKQPSKVMGYIQGPAADLSTAVSGMKLSINGVIDELQDEFDPKGKETIDGGDPHTTRLNVGRLPPQVDKNFLLRTFGKFRPVARVKMKGPITEQEQGQRNNLWEKAIPLSFYQWDPGGKHIQWKEASYILGDKNASKGGVLSRLL